MYGGGEIDRMVIIVPIYIYIWSWVIGLQQPMTLTFGPGQRKWQEPEHGYVLRHILKRFCGDSEAVGIRGDIKGILYPIFLISDVKPSEREGVSPGQDSDYRTLYQIVQFIYKLRETSGNIVLAKSRRIGWETRSQAV